MGSLVMRAVSWIGLEKIRSNRLVQGGFIMTAATVLSGLLGYLYQVLMGRMLSPAEFALFSAVVAIGSFLSAPFGAVYMLLSRRVSELRVHGVYGALRSLYGLAQKYLVFGGMGFLILLTVFSPDVQSYLKSPSLVAVGLLGLIPVCTALLVVNNAFMQGMQRFVLLGGTGTAIVLVKIVLSVLLILLGMGVNGALGGVVLAILLVWLYGAKYIVRDLPLDSEPAQVKAAPFPTKTVLPVLVANLAFAAMTQLDMALVNHYFSPNRAGLYAAASVLGKAILYLPGGLVFALFPMVAENHAKNEESAHLLVQAAGMTLLFCGFAALIYWMFGERIISIFYGPTYAGAGDLLRWYGVAILPMALVMVAENFLIAKGRVLFAWLFLFMAPIQILAIRCWHEEMWMVIAAMGVCGTLLMGSGYGILWWNYRRG